MQPFHFLSSSKNYTTTTASRAPQEVRPRRNTIGTVDDFSSHSSSHLSSDSEMKRSKSWYEGFVGDLLGSIRSTGGAALAAVQLHMEPSLVRDRKVKKMKRVVEDIVRLCPEENRDELMSCHVKLVKQKMKQPTFTIGICGEPESGRRTLLNVLQHSKHHDASKTDISLKFKLCPHINPSHIDSQLSDQFKHSLLSCSAYLYVVSCELIREDHLDTRFLEILLQRDKDIFNQRRALIVANKFDMCFTDTIDARQMPPVQAPSEVTSSTSTSEYLHYDRLLDHDDYEHYVKARLKHQIRRNVGIDVPDNCICPAILKWSQVSRDYHHGIEDGLEVEQRLKEWLDFHEPYRQMTDEVQDMTEENMFEAITGISNIETWVEYHRENIETMKELSLLSDLIHCIHYCTDKLQYEIDNATMKIENLESLLVQKNQLEDNLCTLRCEISSTKRDAVLFDSLWAAYDQDIEKPIESIRKLATELIERFQEMSISKLNRLLHCNFEHFSNEALLETCELDIDSFCRGAANKLNSVLRTVTFVNMHNVLPFRIIKESSHELVKLADHLLIIREQTSLEMVTRPDDNPAPPRMSCTSGLELFYPVTIDAVSDETENARVTAVQLRPHFYSMLHFHSLSISTSHDPTECKQLSEDVKENFISHCEKYLTSEELKRMAVQFHMEIIIDYTSNFLRKFEQNYQPKIDSMKKTITDEICALKQSREKSEMNLKELITLKVDLEVKRADLLIPAAR